MYVACELLLAFSFFIFNSQVVQNLLRTYLNHIKISVYVDGWPDVCILNLLWVIMFGLRNT